MVNHNRVIIFVPDGLTFFYIDIFAANVALNPIKFLIANLLLIIAIWQITNILSLWIISP